jgi:hypothetical protein
MAQRLSLVEKNQYLTSGSASMRDPATDRALVDIAASLATLKASGNSTSGGEAARDKIIAWAFAGLMALLAAGAIVYHPATPQIAPPPIVVYPSLPASPIVPKT